MKLPKHILASVFILVFTLILSNYSCNFNPGLDSFYCESYHGRITSFNKNIKGYLYVAIENDSTHYLGKYLSVECRDKLIKGDSIVKKKASLYLDFYRKGKLNCTCNNNYFIDKITTDCK